MATRHAVECPDGAEIAVRPRSIYGHDTQKGPSSSVPLATSSGPHPSQASLATPGIHDPGDFSAIATEKSPGSWNAAPVIEVIRPGPLATVQDLGRPAFGHLGVPRSGRRAPGAARPRDDWLAAGAIDLLCGADYLVTPASDRTGLRLDGPALPRAITRELASEGMFTGALQIPPTAGRSCCSPTTPSPAAIR